MSKVIIVDDSSTMRQLVRMALRPAGYDIVEAVDGQDGLEKVTQDPSIDLMILDVNMPKMNGVELAESLSASGHIKAGLKVVMLTTEGHAELVDRAKQAGAKGWLVKPFKPEKLLETIQRIAAQ